MYLGNLRKVLGSVLIAQALLACASAPEGTGNGVIAEGPDSVKLAYLSKIALCENVLSYEDVTRYAGVDRDKSPEQRQAEKQNVWQNWQESIDEAKKLVAVNKLEGFNYATFNPEKEREGRMYFNPKYIPRAVKRSDRQYDTYHQNTAIPTTIIFDYLYPKMNLPIFPKAAIYDQEDGKGNYELNQLYEKRNEYIAKKYAPVKKPSHLNPKERDPFISQWFYYSERLYTYRLEQRSQYYRYFQTERKDYAWSIAIDTKKWFEMPESPVKYDKLKKNFYLDLTTFNFYDVFNFYPDSPSSEAVIKINYVYEAINCTDRMLDGNLVEIVISAEETNKELWRVSL